jgi:hypothetical protein
VVHPNHSFIGQLQDAYRARTRSSEYRTELSAGVP